MKALEVRKILKSKKPEFIRQEYNKLKRLEKKWVRPKGIHSKMREKRRGKRALASTGYRSPKEVRGLTREGYEFALARNLNDLNGRGAVVLADVGMRKKLEILKKANEMKIKVLNVKNIEKFLKDAEEMMKKRKEERKARKEKKKEKKVEKVEKKEETPEEKAEREKQEKRKVLEGR